MSRFGFIDPNVTLKYPYLKFTFPRFTVKLSQSNSLLIYCRICTMERIRGGTN